MKERDMLQANKTWMAMVGAALLLMPACVDDEAATHDDFETGDIELDAEPRVLVGDEALAVHEARTSGAAMAAGAIAVCTRRDFVAPAGGNLTWRSCISSDHKMWLSMVGDLEISRSYARLAVAGIDITTGFRSWPKIVAAPNNRIALVDLDGSGMWRPGDWYVTSTAVQAANQPWSWPLLSPAMRW
jgi:hypothetical protein